MRQQVCICHLVWFAVRVLTYQDGFLVGVVSLRDSTRFASGRESPDAKERLYVTREDLEHFGLTAATCPVCVCVGAPRVCPTSTRQEWQEEDRSWTQGTMKAEAAEKRVKENMDGAAERDVLDFKSVLEKAAERRERSVSSARG